MEKFYTLFKLTQFSSWSHRRSDWMFLGHNMLLCFPTAKPKFPEDHRTRSTSKIPVAAIFVYVSCSFTPRIHGCGAWSVVANDLRIECNNVESREFFSEFPPKNVAFPMTFSLSLKLVITKWVSERFKQVVLGTRMRRHALHAGCKEESCRNWEHASTAFSVTFRTDRTRVGQRFVEPLFHKDKDCHRWISEGHLRNLCFGKLDCL